MASEACCAAGLPVKHDYTPKGQTQKHGDMAYYHVGSGPAGVVIITDIFGLEHNQVLQVADRFAEAGMNVIVPDVFHGKPWSLSRFPPKPEDKFMDWINGDCSWEKLSPIITASTDLLKGAGAQKFGCIGFCWGVSIAMRAGQDPMFSAVGGAHPALFGQDAELAAKCQCPVILLPAQGDADLAPVQQEMAKKPFGSKCVYQRFDDQTHGFVAARGDWTKPEVAAAAGKAVDLMSTFLKDNVK